jgi:hypothetical protein
LIGAREAEMQEYTVEQIRDWLVGEYYRKGHNAHDVAEKCKNGRSWAILRANAQMYYAQARKVKGMSLDEFIAYGISLRPRG